MASKEDIQIIERKALDLLQSYWHQLLLRSHNGGNQPFLSPFPVTKTCQERAKEKGRNFTDEIYVKKPERVAVLGDLFLLALAIYHVFQRRVRPFITPERPLKGAGGRKRTRPTGQAIFQLFWYVRVVLLELLDGQIQRRLGKPLTP
ncbi:hypothetical protein DI43_02470 [Geobacillus sp. CAMR12739]|nr:hypothetical protein DI43_02470 [Geobacillus sp. CAMR12739]